MKSEKATTTSILVVLLIYVFMAGNTSGELVLCIGAHWHIAIEPLNHEHNENHPHIEHEEYVKNPHCRVCIDIPIFIGPTDNQLPLKVKSNSNTLVSLVGSQCTSGLHNTGADKWCAMHTLPACPFTDENRFLRSVILLV